MYDPDASLKVAHHSGCITRGNKYKLINNRFHYDQDSTIFLHVGLLSTVGTVFRTMLSMSILSTYLKHAETGSVYRLEHGADCTA